MTFAGSITLNTLGGAGTHTWSGSATLRYEPTEPPRDPTSLDEWSSANASAVETFHPLGRVWWATEYLYLATGGVTPTDWYVALFMRCLGGSFEVIAHTASTSAGLPMPTNESKWRPGRGRLVYPIGRSALSVATSISPGGHPVNESINHVVGTQSLIGTLSS